MLKGSDKFKFLLVFFIVIMFKVWELVKYCGVSILHHYRYIQSTLRHYHIRLPRWSALDKH
jgi:hypothetical protein